MKSFAMLFFILAFYIGECKTIEVHQSGSLAAEKNDDIVIRLQSNPTTGYVWKIEILDNTENVLELKEDKFISPDSNGLVGAGGVHLYTVKAINPGTAHVHARYSRPWEKGIPAIKEFDCLITVK